MNGLTHNAEFGCSVEAIPSWSTGIVQLPGNWDDLIDEPLLAEQLLTIRGFELLLIVE
jgi:hypothetical protein